MAEPAATGSGIVLLGLAVSLGGAVMGPIELVVVFAVGGALIGIGLRGPIHPARGALHLLAGVLNALAGVNVAAWVLARYVGLAPADWLLACALPLGIVGDQYLRAFDVAAIAWRKVRGGGAS